MKTFINNYLENYKGFSREIWILTAMTFLNRAGTMVVPFLSKYLKENLKLSLGEIGWIMVFYGFGSLFGTWLSGKLSDKIGFYKVMLLSLFMSGVTFIMLQFINSFEGLCLGIFLLTTIADMYRPAMLVSLNTYTNKENRTRALTLIRSAVNLGFLFGPLIGGFIIMDIGYSYLFYIDGVTCIIAVLFFYVFVKERKLPFVLKKEIQTKTKSTILDDKPFLLHFLVAMITGILFFQIFTTLPLYHKDKFNLPENYSGLLLSLNGLLILFFELPIVNYIEKKKFNKSKVIFIGILFMVLSFLTMLLFPTRETLILMIILMTFGVILTFPFSNSIAMNRAHRNQEGAYMSFFTMSYSFAHIFSAKIGMEIIEKYGYTSNWIFMTTLGCIGALLGYWLTTILKKENKEIKEHIVSSIFVTKK